MRELRRLTFGADEFNEIVLARATYTAHVDLVLSRDM